MTFERLAPVLLAIGVAEALGEPFGPGVLARLADESDVSTLAIQSACAYAHATGLAHILGGDGVPQLMNAGRQYLARRGEVEHAALSFLPMTVDDLNARAALLRAGGVLVDEFRHAILAGSATDHAAALVPPAFAQAMTPRIALDLFAAATALMARLEAEEPAACVAEELIALELIAYADSWLEVEVQDGALSHEDASCARAHLPSLLGLFQDIDIVRMMAWKEPADAAVARHDGSASAAGAVDQRLEAWFRPFAGAAPTGYLLADPA